MHVLIFVSSCTQGSHSCLEKIPRLFQDLQNAFSRRLYCMCATDYWTYCTCCHPQPTPLTKCTVHKDAIPRCITHGMPNMLKFIATLFQ